MKYAVVHIPKVDVSRLASIAEKYHPQHYLLEPHLTLVFPFDVVDASEKDLVLGVEQSVRNIQPFELHLNKLEPSWDHWLFLCASAGRKHFEAVHRALYAHPIFVETIGLKFLTCRTSASGVSSNHLETNHQASLN